LSNVSNLWDGKPFGKKRLVVGWFSDPEKAATLAVQIGAEGIYTTLNYSLRGDPLGRPTFMGGLGEYEEFDE
jgi:hypothetical protein